MRTIYFSLLIIVSSYGYTQVPVPTFRDIGHQNNYDLLPHLLIWESRQNVSVEKAYAKVLSEGIIRLSSNLGYSNNEYWILLSIVNDSDDLAQRLLEIGNPQIDSITVYRIGTDSIPKIWTRTGDAFTFYDRLIDHRNFLFPFALQPFEQATLLIRINKKNSSLTVPIYWWHTSSYFEMDNKKILGYGFYFGFLGLCFIYASLTFYFLRKRIYFWYAVWVLITALYVATSMGLSFQLLYPNLTVNTHFRVIILIFSLYTFIRFAQEFLLSSKYTPVLHKSLSSIAFLNLGLIPLGLITKLVWPEALIVLLATIYALTVTCMVIIFIISVITYSKQRMAVLFYYLAFGVIIISALSIIYSEFGFGSNKDLGVNPYMVGSAIELLIFSIALTYQIKKLYEERNSLSIRIVNQQKEMLSAYVNGIERERERISLELHDDIGSRLSNLKRFIKESTKDGVHLDEQIDGICSDVRNLSHQLAPPSLQHNTLIKLINELAEKTTRACRLSVQVQEYDFPEILPDNIQTALFRVIQEGLENSVKHSRATEVDIQFFGYQNDLVVTYEDNGQGFDMDSQPEGIGLKNIRARILSIEGKLEIQSSQATGTILIIQIPRQEIALVSPPST